MMNSPNSEEELLLRCQAIAGFSFNQLSMHIGQPIPSNPNHRKGWVGQALELALGANGYNQSVPDFQALSIELKTLPMGKPGKPSESTFVTTIPLLTIQQQQWESSQCYSKLKRVLWVPIEGDVKIPYSQRRIGQGFLWSPNEEEESILSADWNYLASLIITGQLETIDATLGTYLQIRPKAANGKSLCYAFDAEGNKVQTLPRGFYLRSSFTGQIIREHS